MAKWTAEEIQRKIEWEGFDYFFVHYISPDDIVDEELKNRAKRYRNARYELRSYLERL